MELKNKLIHFIYENDDFFDKMQEEAPDGYWICEMTDPFPIWADRKFKDLFNYTHTGKETTLYLPSILDKQSFNQVKNYCIENAKRKLYSESLNLQYQFREMIIPVVCNLVILQDTNGIITHVIGLNRMKNQKYKDENTRLKEKALDSKRFFDHALDMLCIAGFDGYFKVLNPAWTRILGWTTEELLSRPWNDFVHPDDLKATNEIKSSIVYGQPAYQFKNRYRCKDGSYKLLSWSSFPYPADNVMYGVARDLTEANKTQLKLKEEEEKLNHLRELFAYVIEHNNAAIAIHDKNLRYIYVSQRFLDDYNVKDKNIIGKHHYEVFPDIPQKWRDVHQRALNGEVLSAEEDKYPRSDGTVDWTRWNCRPWYTVENEIGGIILYTEIITHRKLIEEKLRQKSSYLNKLINSANAQIIIWNPHAEITRVNVAMERLTGFTQEELLGQHIGILFPEKERDATLAKLTIAMQGNSWDVEEIKIQTKKGELRTVLWNSANIYHNENNALVETLAQGQDITDRKLSELALRESEERYRNILEVSPAGKLIIQDNLIVLCNSAGLEVLGADNRESVLNAKIKRFFTDDTWSDLSHHFEQMLAEKSVFAPYETRIICLDGKEKDIEIRAGFMNYNENSAILLILTDVTESKKMREELVTLNAELEHRIKERTAQLEASNKELEAFSYSVSHDLRAPLRHIGGYVNLLKTRFESDLPEKAQHYLQTIADSSQQMGQLIDDLLNLSKTGRKELNWEKLDFNCLLKEVLDILQNEKEGRHIQWKISKMPAVTADYSLMRQVWTNLIQNALKYTLKKEKALIEINHYKDKGHIVFSIKDNGVGFDMQYAGKLFGVFQRLHSSDAYEGTGIGLATVQRIIHKHGGLIWANSQPDNGAEFQFSLPIKKHKLHNGSENDFTGRR
ncbi:MAG: PAS domain S-box protein [Cyclobacteriaceae bacterium]|nr:PAS domain S-box protein [Cyclobacteriaceae bacterium]